MEFGDASSSRVPLGKNCSLFDQNSSPLLQLQSLATKSVSQQIVAWLGLCVNCIFTGRGIKSMSRISKVG